MESGICAESESGKKKAARRVEATFCEGETIKEPGNWHRMILGKIRSS